MPDERDEPFRWEGTMAEFDAEVRRRWIESSERLGLDHGMPNAAAALAAQEQPAPDRVLVFPIAATFNGEPIPVSEGTLPPDLGTVWRLLDEARALVAEIIAEVEGWSRDPLDTDHLIADWRTRAKLEDK